MSRKLRFGIIALMAAAGLVLLSRADAPNLRGGGALQATSRSEAAAPVAASLVPRAFPLRFTGESASRFVAVAAQRRSVVEAGHLALEDAAGSIPRRVAFRLSGADPAATVEAIEPNPGPTHEIVGSDPGAWRTNQVTYRGVQPPRRARSRPTSCRA